MLTPQEVELLGVFRQLDAAARLVLLEMAREARDELHREVARVLAAPRCPPPD